VKAVHLRGHPMHVGMVERWAHEHRFHAGDSGAERRTLWVAGITAATMCVEVVAGWLSGSMALLADGWHMGTHMFALGISVYAYRFARRHRDNPAFSFGTGKVGSLGGFASAVVLGMVALAMVGEAVLRLFTPQEILFSQAMTVAVIGFAVNAVCAWLLHGAHGDHNLRAALVHVVADAVTSVLAMGALVCVRFFGLRWMDPAVALLGAGLILRWAVGLLRETSGILLDAGVSGAVVAKIRTCIESDSDNMVSDLHVWRVGGEALSVAVSVVTHNPRPAEHYKALLGAIPEVRHSTVEVLACDGESCLRG